MLNINQCGILNFSYKHYFPVYLILIPIIES